MPADNIPDSSSNEFKRGLHLLAPEFRVLEEKLNALSSQMKEVKSTLALKEDVSNVDQLKVEVASMMPTLKQKADEAEVQRINTHLQQIQGTVTQKADTSVVEHLAQQFTALSASAATKGELAALPARIEQLNTKIETGIRTIQNTLDNFDVAGMSSRLDTLKTNNVTQTQLKENLTPLKNMLDTLNHNVLQKAESVDLASLRVTLEGVQEAVKEKAEGSIVEQLNTQYRLINKALAQKAEFTEVEDVRSQVKVLGSTIEQKAGHAQVDALSVMLKGLTGGLASTIDEKVELIVQSKYKLDVDKLTEFVNKNVSDLKSSIADVQKNLKEKSTVADLDKLGKQVQVVVDAMAQKTAKMDEFAKQLADLKTALGKKSEDSRVDIFVKKLEDLSASVEKNNKEVKAELKSLGTNLEDCKKTVAKKAEDDKVDKLAVLMEGCAKKAVVEELVKQMDSAVETLARKSVRLDELEKRIQEVLSFRGVRFDELEKRLGEIQDLSAILGKIDKLDNLSGQVDLLFNKMASKADNLVQDELLNNLRKKADNDTVDQLTTKMNVGMDTMSRRVRMLIDAMINTIRRNALGSEPVRVGGGFVTENRASDAPPDADLIAVLQQIAAEDLSPRPSSRANVDSFGVDSPLSSPRTTTRDLRGDDPVATSQIRRDLDDLYTTLSRKADKSALSTLAAEFQRLSDFTMTQVLQAPSSLPPGSLRPQSARAGAPTTRPQSATGGAQPPRSAFRQPARPTTPTGGRHPRFGV